MYVNNEHCNSVEQLKSYFSNGLVVGSELYSDMLDYGRYGDIAAWLREQGYTSLADTVDAIDSKLGDADFINQLCEVITGQKSISEIKKEPFEKCFEYINMKYSKKNAYEVIIQFTFLVLKSINENYEMVVRCFWGTKVQWINPYKYEEGKQITLDFKFYSCIEPQLNNVSYIVDGKEFSCNPFERIQDNNKKVYEVGDVYFEMIYVKGDTFEMGEDSDAHQVTISDFMCGSTPVSQALWMSVMGNNPSTTLGEDTPVDYVSWDDCQIFLDKINKITGQRFRLLTEEEWEYAARGGYLFKNCVYDVSNEDKAERNTFRDITWSVLREFWKCENPESHFPKVDKKTLNTLGVHVDFWEWCNDKNYGSGVYGPGVLRCGNFKHSVQIPSESHRVDHGFRLALSLGESHYWWEVEI